jgi:predicted amidohydrolase
LHEIIERFKMKNVIKLAAIHSGYLKLPEAAHPSMEKFNTTAVLKYIRDNIESNLHFLQEAGQNGADLVCTHEDFMGTGIYMMHLDRPELFASFAEEIPGPTSREIGEIAKRCHMHVAVNYFEKCGGEIYNTSVLIGRNGEVTGKYRKVHLPPSEKWRLKGGNEFPVFETDIGRIGFATCYDVIFPEHCRAVALNGADIIIHQTAGWGIGDYGNKGEELVKIRAVENSVYMLVAKNAEPDGNGKSCIIDNYGNILAEASGAAEKVVLAEFEPDYDKNMETYFNSLFSGIDSFKARIALEREPSLYSILTDKRPPLLGQYEGVELQTETDKVDAIFKKWKAYWADIEAEKPVTVKYHW